MNNYTYNLDEYKTKTSETSKNADVAIVILHLLHPSLENYSLQQDVLIHIDRTLSLIPMHCKDAVIDQYVATYDDCGEYTANLFITRIQTYVDVVNVIPEHLIKTVLKKISRIKKIISFKLKNQFKNILALDNISLAALSYSEIEELAATKAVLCSQKILNAESNIDEIDEAVKAKMIIQSSLHYAEKYNLTVQGNPITKRKKLESPDIWNRRLKQIKEIGSREIGRIFGFVGGASDNDYISSHTRNFQETKHQSSMAWMETMVVKNGDVEIPLIDLYTRKQISKRASALSWLNGMDEYAGENNLQGAFITITCPSKFHISSASADHYTIEDGHKYLTHMWHGVELLLASRRTKYYGVRAVEPHKDGLPHLHMIIYADEKSLLEIDELLKEKSCEIDNFETTSSDSQRYDFRIIDTELGNPSAYITKHIMDDYNPKNANKAVKGLSDIAYWVKDTRIRQLQFFRCPSKGLWDELRRRNDPFYDDDRLEEIRCAAKDGDFCKFFTLLGGHTVKMKDHYVQLIKKDAVDIVQSTVDRITGEYTETETPRITRYGEAIREVHGFVVLDRLYEINHKKWELVDRTLSYEEAMEKLGWKPSCTISNNFNLDNQCLTDIPLPDVPIIEKMADIPLPELSDLHQSFIDTIIRDLNL